MSCFERYLLKLANEYKIDEKKLITDWKSFNNEHIQPHIENSPEPAIIVNKCIYQYSRGDMKGKMCGCSIRKKDKMYCSKHNKYNKPEVKDEKDDNKHNINDNKECNKENTQKNDVNKNVNNNEEVNKKPKKLIIRMNPVVNKFVHSITGFIFF